MRIIEEEDGFNKTTIPRHTTERNRVTDVSGFDLWKATIQRRSRAGSCVPKLSANRKNTNVYERTRGLNCSLTLNPEAVCISSWRIDARREYNLIFGVIQSNRSG